MSRRDDENERPVPLQMAESGVSDVRSLPPLEHSFPGSRKVEEGELRVPFREIALSGGEPPLRVYDTTGPEACDVREGLPPRRGAWLAGRLAEGRASERGVTQLYFARRGVI